MHANVIQEWMEAACADDMAAMEKLLEGDAMLINAVHPEFERTALMMAAAWNSAAATTFLLSRGANIALTDPDGNTALHLAVGANATAALKRLLNNASSGTDRDVLSPLLNQRNAFGYTVLHIAAEEGCDACVDLLLTTTNASIDATIELAQPPFHTALDLALHHQHHSIAMTIQQYLVETHDRKR